MRTSTRIFFSIQLVVSFMFLIAAGTRGKRFEGMWKGAFDYEYATYHMELSIAKNEDGNLSGNLRVLESGNEVGYLSLKSVVLSGDSLMIQTSSIEGKGAMLILKSDAGKLVGSMGATFSDKLEGATWKVVLEKGE